MSDRIAPRLLAPYWDVVHSAHSKRREPLDRGRRGLSIRPHSSTSRDAVDVTAASPRRRIVGRIVIVPQLGASVSRAAVESTDPSSARRARTRIRSRHRSPVGAAPRHGGPPTRRTTPPWPTRGGPSALVGQRNAVTRRLCFGDVPALVIGATGTVIDTGPNQPARFTRARSLPSWERRPACGDWESALRGCRHGRLPTRLSGRRRRAGRSRG